MFEDDVIAERFRSEAEKEFPDFEDYGKPVELREPYRGYSYGHIVGLSGYKYIIQLSSGLEICAYRDEFEFL